jgi:hypothetical protein
VGNRDDEDDTSPLCLLPIHFALVNNGEFIALIKGQFVSISTGVIALAKETVRNN